MGVINDYKETFKKTVKPKLSVKGMIEDAKEIGLKKGAKKGPSVNADVDRLEFSNRYKGLLSSLYICFSVLAFCFFQALTSDGIVSTAFCLLLTVICSMFYFRYCFTAWRARGVYNNWQKRNIDKSVFYSDFIDAIQLNWKEVLPLPLPKETK